MIARPSRPAKGLNMSTEGVPIMVNDQKANRATHAVWDVYDE